MSNDPVTIPDFLPTSFQADVDEVRRQVENSHLERHEADMAAADGDSEPRRVRARAPRRAPRVAGSDVPVVTGAALIALIGVAGLTGVWAWLATTHDPMWWSFTAGGAVVFAGLAVLVGALLRRGRMLITGARSEHGREEPAPTSA